MSEKKRSFFFRDGTLDEQERERQRSEGTRCNPKNRWIECIITIAHGQYTESKDDDREHARRSYRKTVSTIWLNKKPHTEHHHTSKPEKIADHFWNQQW